MADWARVLKRLPDDVVEYSVFPQIPDDLPNDDIKDFLEKQADAILAHLSDRIVNYIWQHESFSLRPVLSSTDSVPPHLHGSTSFGDNIDDEWFIVHLLYEVTREFAGAVARVNDNDEEFLLIEAAHELPKWLDPETAEKRVYIYNGDLHVIPIPQSTEEFLKYPLFTPTFTEAVACVRDCACETRCSQAIQNVLNKRLSCFPRRAVENMHSTNCFLPTSLAVLLAHHPSLVSAGVRSFYYRDPLELKSCRPMKRFKPDDLVRTRVKMTRCLYAQLMQQQFTPDRLSGWKLVAPSNPEFNERDIGIKLAHGFEILCSKCQNVDSTQADEKTVDDSSPRWQQFKKSLSSKGYFRGEIEGSILYKKLLNEAKAFFLLQISSGDSEAETMAEVVLRYVKQLEPKFEEFRRAERRLPPSDDDSWLNVTPEQVDEMMRNGGSFSASGGPELFDLSKVAESFTSFVEHESGIDGAEFPRESSENDGGDGQFESSGLIQAMQKIFEFPDEQDSTGSDMSEYGWSDGSEDELGSPSKMAKVTKKSSMKKSKTPRAGDHVSSPVEKTAPKSVRFSTPNSVLLSEAYSTDTSPVPPPLPPRPSGPPPRPSGPPPVSPANRPTKLASTSQPSRPSNPPPPKPASNPPPLPARPPRLKDNLRPLANATVKPTVPPPPPPASGGKRDKKLEALMEAMDRELAATDVGKSFEREPKQTKPKPPGRHPASQSSKAAQKKIEDEDDDFQPVDIDLNIVKNTLESYKAQQGLPGPASNILAGFGIRLPQDKVNGKS